MLSRILEARFREQIGLSLDIFERINRLDEVDALLELVRHIYKKEPHPFDRMRL